MLSGLLSYPDLKVRMDFHSKKILKNNPIMEYCYPDLLKNFGLLPKKSIRIAYDIWGILYEILSTLPSETRTPSIPSPQVVMMS